MAFRSFTDSTPWEQARRELRFTVTRTAARRAHALLVEPLRDILAQWDELERERRDADDLLVDADAIVEAQTEELNDAVMALAAELLHEAEHDPADLTYRAYFPGLPGEIAHLGLARALARTREFATVAREIEPSFEVSAILEIIAAIEKRSIEALAIHEEAEQNVDRVSLLVRTWKRTANAARHVLLNALSAHAQQHRLARGYADAFFPTSSPPRRVMWPFPRVTARSAA